MINIDDFVWDEAEHALFMGQLKPEPNTNGKERAQEAWLRYIVKLKNGSTAEEHGFYLKADVMGSSQKNVDLDYLPDGIPKVSEAWEPVCQKLWEAKFPRYIETMERLRVTQLQTGKTGRKSKKASKKSKGQTPSQSLEDDDALEKELHNVGKHLSTEKLRELALYIQRATRIRKAPSVELVKEMRDMFEFPGWIKYLKTLGQYPPPGPPSGTKRQRNATSPGTSPEKEREKRLKVSEETSETVELPEPILERYTFFSGVQRMRLSNPFLVADPEDAMETEQLLESVRQLYHALPDN
ncbi:hypothetical protein N0V94_007996 [Neodidymelliopsis sp. IMI 364377]|nr:hypothetical protein N0V94_007996 [Neodidymelliopsis sp. IMI 364377]